MDKQAKLEALASILDDHLKAQGVPLVDAYELLDCRYPLHLKNYAEGFIRIWEAVEQSA